MPMDSILVSQVNRVRSKNKEVVIYLLKQIEKFINRAQLQILVFIANLAPPRFHNGISNQIGELKSTGILSSSIKERKALMDLHIKWHEAASEFTKGNFLRSTALRKECLEEIYAMQGVDLSSNYYPPLLNDGYFGAIGHMAFYFLHQESRGYELTNGPRYVLKPTRIVNQPFFDFIRKDDHIIPLSRFSLTNSLALSSLIENLEVVRTQYGFSSIYNLAENYGIRQLGLRQNRRMELTSKAKSVIPDYWEQAPELLKNLSFDPDTPFVVLHVRDLSGHDLRGASVENFLPSIKYLLNEGFQVLRVGRRESTLRGFNHKGFFDLASSDFSEHLLLYLLLNCKALISTQSGVAVAANMLSCPSLVTNVIAMGRTTFTFPETTYLPKILLKKGKVADFDDYCSPSVGLADATKGFLRRMNLELRENTSLELLRTTKEFISEISNSNWQISDWESSKLNEKRKMFGAVTLGRLSAEFIDITNANSN